MHHQSFDFSISPNVSVAIAAVPLLPSSTFLLLRYKFIAWLDDKIVYSASVFNRTRCFFISFFTYVCEVSSASVPSSYWMAQRTAVKTA